MKEECRSQAGEECGSKMKEECGRKAKLLLHIIFSCV